MKVLMIQIHAPSHFQTVCSPASFTRCFVNFFISSTASPNCQFSCSFLCDPEPASCAGPSPNPKWTSPCLDSFFKLASNNLLKPEAHRILMSLSASFATSQPWTLL